MEENITSIDKNWTMCLIESYPVTKQLVKMLCNRCKKLKKQRFFQFLAPILIKMLVLKGWYPFRKNLDKIETLVLMESYWIRKDLDKIEMLCNLFEMLCNHCLCLCLCKKWKKCIFLTAKNEKNTFFSFFAKAPNFLNFWQEKTEI